VLPAAEDRKDDEQHNDADAVFDPYVVLGVSRTAGQNDVHVAYEQARSKYDPDLVSHLGDDARAHFQAKAQSVERAYQMLTGSGTAPHL
jgi:preprotein translocase subunit Sec63